MLTQLDRHKLYIVGHIIFHNILRMNYTAKGHAIVCILLNFYRQWNTPRWFWNPFILHSSIRNENEWSVGGAITTISRGILIPSHLYLILVAKVGKVRQRDLWFDKN